MQQTRYLSIDLALVMTFSQDCASRHLSRTTWSPHTGTLSLSICVHILASQILALLASNTGGLVPVFKLSEESTRMLLRRAFLAYDKVLVAAYIYIYDHFRFPTIPKPQSHPSDLLEVSGVSTPQQRQRSQEICKQHSPHSDRTYPHDLHSQQ